MLISEGEVFALSFGCLFEDRGCGLENPIFWRFVKSVQTKNCGFYLNIY
jgi:hypothetical protein